MGNFKEQWEQHVQIPDLLLSLGVDLEAEALEKTPERVGRAWEELLQGYTLDPNEILERTFESEGHGPVMCRNIEFCSICFGAGTKILMNDFSWKSIEEINIGEEVVSVSSEPRKKKRFASGKVTHTSSRMAATIDVDGIRVTPQHPFIAQCRGGWGAYRKVKAMNLGGKLLQRLPQENIEDDAYKLGYLAGAFDGDGCFSHAGKSTTFGLFCVDREIGETIRKYLADLFDLEVPLKRKKTETGKTQFGVNFSKRTKELKTAVHFREVPYPRNREYMKGYLAGIFDTDGTVDTNMHGPHQIRIAQKRIKLLEGIQKYARALGFKAEINRYEGAGARTDEWIMSVLRIADPMRFYCLTRPKVLRKCKIECTLQTLGERKACTVNYETLHLPVYNLTVEPHHNYIPNGMVYALNCEHHMIPFFGVCHIAYIPGERVVGLSKLTRLVDCFAQRLQIQERLTCQICDALTGELDEYTHNLSPSGVLVITVARHLCCLGRGVKRTKMDFTCLSQSGEIYPQLYDILLRGV